MDVPLRGFDQRSHARPGRAAPAVTGPLAVALEEACDARRPREVAPGNGCFAGVGMHAELARLPEADALEHLECGTKVSVGRFGVSKRELEQAEYAFQVDRRAARSRSERPQLLTELPRLIDVAEMSLGQCQGMRRHQRKLRDLQVLGELERRDRMVPRQAEVSGPAFGGRKLHESDRTGRLLPGRRRLTDERLEQPPGGVEVVDPPEPEAEHRGERLPGHAVGG